MTPSPRPPEARMRDTLTRLATDVDCWVATADASGTPYLIPLSHLWDGSTLLLSTASSSPTSRNLLANGDVRVSIGHTRDVILIEGTAEAIPAAELAADTGDAFAAATGFDPRTLNSPYHYFRVRPRRIQAWREANELDGRDLMRNGAWLYPLPD